MLLKRMIGISLCLLFLWIPLSGQKKKRAEQENETPQVEIIANYKEKVPGLMFATGNVEIRYGEMVLFADRAEYNTETKEVFAEGNVVLHLSREVIDMDSLRINLDSLAGSLQKVRGMIQPSVFYTAESLEREENEIIHLKKAEITSCTQTVPRWKFNCSRADLKKEDYVKMWNAVFSIKKVPVFYLPYMRFPLEQERATGFLIPQVGISARKGFFYSQNFFWAMRRNMDATFNFDYFGSRGVGGGLEYRYLFDQGMGGRLNLYYFHFKNNPDYENPDNAYLIRFSHNQPLPFGFKFVADVDYQSSYDFLREFDNNFQRAIVTNRRSSVYVSRAWSYYSLNLRLSRFETHFQANDNSIIRNEVPYISFSSSKIKLINPLYFSFSSSFESWEYGWETDYEDDSQKSSQSIVFRPTLTIPFNSIPWISLTSSVTASYTYSFQSYRPNTKTIDDIPLFSHIYTGRMEFTGPVFYKVYFNKKNEPWLKHIIEPRIIYQYDSPTNISDRIITTRFFYRDHYLNYGLVNRFLIKQNDMPREILTLGISQSYFFEPEESSQQNYLVDGEIPAFTDVNAYLRLYPLSGFNLDVSADFNPYYGSFSRLRLGAGMGRANDPFFVHLNWYKSINPYREVTLTARHQISLYGGLKIPKIGLDTQLELDYNIEEKRMLYTAFSFIYHYQCLDFVGDVRVFYFRDKPELQFRFSFALGNIGKTTDFLGGIGF